MHQENIFLDGSLSWPSRIKKLCASRKTKFVVMSWDPYRSSKEEQKAHSGNPQILGQVEELPRGRNKLGTCRRPWSVDAEDWKVLALSADRDINYLSGGERREYTCPRLCLPKATCTNILTPPYVYGFVLSLACFL